MSNPTTHSTQNPHSTELAYPRKAKKNKKQPPTQFKKKGNSSKRRKNPQKTYNLFSAANLAARSSSSSGFFFFFAAAAATTGAFFPTTGAVVVPGTLIVGCTFSVVGDGGATLTGPLIVLGGASSASPSATASAELGSSSSSAGGSGGEVGGLRPHAILYVRAISFRYSVTSVSDGGSTRSFLSTRSPTLLSVFSMAARANSLPYFSTRSCRAWCSSLISVRGAA